jgi:hypothetical protein
LTEEQSLKLRAIELNDWSAYVGQIYNDLANLTDGVQARWEIDRGALLNTGALTVTALMAGPSASTTACRAAISRLLACSGRTRAAPTSSRTS